ncbi:MAG: hypothetical protein F4X64_06740 [Chloroflexi bacterium]|nr:hypothetical protein [Chloroflexota bacterium]
MPTRNHHYRLRLAGLFVLLCVLAVALVGFGGSAQSPLPTPTEEPTFVGPVTNLVASAQGQDAGAVRLTWTAAENALVHFIVYLKSEDYSAGNYTDVRMVPFNGSEGVISGLEGGTSYDFIARGMRLNFNPYDEIWGGWSQWVSATPSMAQSATTGTTTTPSPGSGGGAGGLIPVSSLAQLNAIRWDLDGDGVSDNAEYAAAFPNAASGHGCPASGCAGYELTTDLDFDTNGNGVVDAGDAYWNNGAGWEPIGTGNGPFKATFDGAGHTISNLYIRRAPEIGLFGAIHSGSLITRTGLVSTNVATSGYGSAGALAGINNGAIKNSYSNGLVAGCVDNIGGLVGANNGSIAGSRSVGEVRSARKTGGGGLLEGFQDLIGIHIFGASGRTCYTDGGGFVGQNIGSITDSHSTSEVSGFNDNFGGLVGSNRDGVIDGSYATGNVSGNGYADVGGLVGDNRAGRITGSHATGSVSGNGDLFGGLIGRNAGTVAASYAAGTVSGNGFSRVGGLVGGNDLTGNIIATYASGTVSGRGDFFGGLVGRNSGSITASYATGRVSGNSGSDGSGLLDFNSDDGVVTNSYWDTQTSGHTDSDGGVGKTTQELQSPTDYTGIYTGWNVDLNEDGSADDPWDFGTSNDYPKLKSVAPAGATGTAQPSGSTNNPPVVQTITAQNATVGTNLTVTVSATDADAGDTLTYRAASSNTAVATVSVSGNVVTVTPVAAGTTTITVIVSDGQATATKSFTVSVTAATGTQQSSSSDLQSPQNVQFIWNNDQVEVSWDAVPGAEYYKVYHNDFSSTCRVRSDGSVSFCELLAGNVSGTTYTHTNPDEDRNHYWIAACNSEGCSNIVAATFVDTRPSPPTNVVGEFVGQNIRISWDAVSGADYYEVYYDDFRGSLFFADLLATNVTATTYLHTEIDDENWYWVSACNSGGCSDPVGATPVEPVPDKPTNVQYVRDGSTMRVSWDAVEGADYYQVYYEDFHSSFSFAELLVDNVSGTTYTHTSPDEDRNYYWVAACNRGGCSEVTTAVFIDTRPAAPTNVRYVRDGSSIRVSWNAVSGADYYRIYYEDFFSSFFFADVLVSSVTGTSYLHTDPDEDTNYYWVAACNSGGCSESVSATSDGT